MAIPRMVDRVGQVLGGRYRLIAPIGTGASASVYLGDDVVLRRRVAVKVLHAALADDEAFLRRFRAEAQAAAALNHPHVMAVYDWGQDEEVPYLVTEFLGGGSLRSLLDQGPVLTPSQALLVGLETARGLEYAHRRGFVHRDIKPANLLFDDEARLRIADFGLARALAEAAWTEPMGAVLGTAKYASPEQARGETLDGRSDVYSLALVLVEAVTGQVPFAGDTTIGTLMARVDAPLPVPEALGPLQAAVAAAGAPHPGDRPDAAELAVLLMGAAEQLERPAPLPLPGVARLDALGVADRDPTAVVPEPVAPAVAGAVAAGAVAGAVAGAAEAPAGKGGRWSRRKAAKAAAAAQASAVVDLTGPVARVGEDPSGELEVPDWVLPATSAEAGEDAAVLPVEHTAGGPDAAAAHGAGGPVGVDEDDTGVHRVAEVAGRSPTALAVADAPGPGDEVPEDEDRRGRRAYVVLLVLVALAAAGAGGWWYLQRTPTADVPGLVGQPVAVAEQAAADHDWELVRTDEFSDTAAAGEVLTQDPPAGTTLDEGEGVLTVTVSRGPPPVAVPTDLAGLPLAEATAALEAVGLAAGDVTQVFDEEVPADAVISLGEGVGAEVPKGSAVPLVVSKGPEPRTIPEGLAGIAVTDAVAQLEALGLVPVISQQYDESGGFPEGQSMGTDPGPGVEVAKGAEVIVIESLGLPIVAVPDVAGLSVVDAAAQLEAKGLVVSSTQGSPTKPVVGTDPAVGTEVRIGSSIVLVTG